MPRRVWLAERRRALGLTQEQLAEQLGVERSTVVRWEAGQTVPRPGMHRELARVLQLPVLEVANVLNWAGRTGQPAPAPATCPADELNDPEAQTDRRQFLSAFAGTSIAASAPLPWRPTAPSPVSSWASAIEQALFDPLAAARPRPRAHGDDPAGRVLGSGEPGHMHRVRRYVDLLTAASLASRHAALSRWLPSTIGTVELLALRAGNEGQAAAAQRLLADVYAVAGWTLIKADSGEMSVMAARRSISAAERADDPARLVAGIRCLSEAQMRAGQLSEAVQTALVASVHADGELRERGGQEARTWCLRGAALLGAAAAAARRSDARLASSALAAAAACGERLGRDHVELGTVFGPTNVAIHRVAIAIELGDARTALEHVGAVDVRPLPAMLVERRARYLIDVARAYAAAGDDVAAVDALLQAERQGPDETRTHRQTHAVVHALMARERRTSGLREFAVRCQVVA